MPYGSYIPCVHVLKCVVHGFLDLLLADKLHRTAASHRPFRPLNPARTLAAFYMENIAQDGARLLDPFRFCAELHGIQNDLLHECAYFRPLKTITDGIEINVKHIFIPAGAYDVRIVIQIRFFSAG